MKRTLVSFSKDPAVRWGLHDGDKTGALVVAAAAQPEAFLLRRTGCPIMQRIDSLVKRTVPVSRDYDDCTQSQMRLVPVDKTLMVLRSFRRRSKKYSSIVGDLSGKQLNAEVSIAVYHRNTGTYSSV